MPIIEILKRFSGHAALALAFLYFVLLALEKQIPGFVSPLVDLAEMGLAALALSVVAVFLLARSQSRWRGVMSSGIFFLMAATLLFYLSTRVLDLGWRGYALLAAAAFLAAVGYSALWRGKLPNDTHLN